MSGTLFGLTDSDFIPQADFQARQDDKGFWTASQSFKATRAAIENFDIQAKLRSGLLATELDPNLETFWEFLTLERAEVSHEEGGWTTYQLHFTGFSSANYDGDEGTIPTTYSLSGTLEEAPILEHPKVVALGTAEPRLLSQILNGQAIWNVADSEIGYLNEDTGEFEAWETQDLTSGDGVAFADLIARGVQSYKRPSFTWRKEWVSTSFPSSASLNNLGNIDTPDGSPPTPNGGRDWMMVSVDSVQTGAKDGAVRNSMAWLLSDREGYDSDMYS